MYLSILFIFLGSIALMIRENADYQELYDEVKGELKNLPHPF